MIKINSTLENTYIKGVLVKKGENSYPDAEYAVLQSSPIFQVYVKRGVIKLSEAEKISFKQPVQNSNSKKNKKKGKR